MIDLRPSAAAVLAAALLLFSGAALPTLAAPGQPDAVHGVREHRCHFCHTSHKAQGPGLRKRPQTQSLCVSCHTTRLQSRMQGALAQPPDGRPSDPFPTPFQPIQPNWPIRP